MKALLIALAVAGALSACVPAVIGTGAVVARSVAQERSTLDALNDTEIQLSLSNRLLNHSGALYGDVSADVTEGRVLLTGSVPTRNEKIAATDIAWQTPGVRAVADELTIAEDSGTQAYLEDVWISNQVRFALTTEGSIRSINYSVETVDKVVHLTGLARSPSELARAIDTAAAVPGVSRVISHVLTIDDPRRIADIPQQKG